MTCHPLGDRGLSVVTPWVALLGRAMIINGLASPIVLALTRTGVAILAPLGPLGPLPFPRAPTFLAFAADETMRGTEIARERRLGVMGFCAARRLAAPRRLLFLPRGGTVAWRALAPRSARRPPGPSSSPRWSPSCGPPAITETIDGPRLMAPATVMEAMTKLAQSTKAPVPAAFRLALLLNDLLLAVCLLARPRTIRRGWPRPDSTCTTPPRGRKLGGGLRLGCATPMRRAIPLAPASAPFCFIVQRRQGFLRMHALLRLRLGPRTAPFSACRCAGGCGESSRRPAGPSLAPSLTRALP